MCFVVAIDLSAPSRSAIELSAVLARATGLAPLLLHVSEGHPPLRLLADLYSLAEPLRAFGSTPRLRTVQGDPATAICEQATARNARFVVMGTHGPQPTPSSRPGSVAQRVMTGCPLPVIAVQPGERSFDRLLLSVPPSHPTMLWLRERMDAQHGAASLAASLLPPAVPEHTAHG
jgi:nucleotide-binding universal stress UspA family protein